MTTRKMHGCIRMGLGLALWAGVIAATAVDARADSLAAEVPAATAPDRALYLKYCGSCHGPDGKGDGLLSGMLNPRPTDLTQLQKQAGGKWDPVAVARTIDGTKAVRAHGSSDMPVWGEVLRDQGESDPRAVQRKIAQIVAYLHSVQVQ